MILTSLPGKMGGFLMDVKLDSLIEKIRKDGIEKRRKTGPNRL
jgi:hypothetical protein